MIKGSFLHWFRVKNIPDFRGAALRSLGTLGGQKNQHLTLYYNRENDLKLKFLRGKKVDILTKEAKAKINLESKQKNFALKKAYFLGPCNSGR